jgi:hypothetical protein
MANKQSLRKPRIKWRDQVKQDKLTKESGEEVNKDVRAALVEGQ